MKQDLGISTVYWVKENLWAIDEIGRTIMYVYAGSKKVLLLDTGFGLLDLKALVGKLCPGKEIVVVNTHAHGDHNSGNGQFERVYVGRRDAKLSRCDMDEATRERFCAHFLKKEPKLAGRDLSAWKPRAAKESVSLADGDVIDLGGVSLEVLETPGHTVGSICLLDRANGFLFTGDMMLTWQVWGQLSCSSALSEYGKSLHRLAELKPIVKEIFPAHGKADNPFGWPIYHLDPDVPTIYDQGVQKILRGELVGKPYTCFLEDGLCALFPVGGMVYHPDRLGEAVGGEKALDRVAKTR